MSQWITDRLPTAEDASWPEKVLVTTEFNLVIDRHWSIVKPGQPWQPIQYPAPYVKPKRWTLTKSRFEGYDNWLVFRDGQLINILAAGLTHEAAQRICDIYNEVMP